MCLTSVCHVFYCLLLTGRCLEKRTLSSYNSKVLYKLSSFNNEEITLVAILEVTMKPTEHTLVCRVCTAF